MSAGGDPGRSCRVCGGRMRSWVRHLHELRQGQTFIWPGTQGPVERLQSCSEGFAWVWGVERNERSFETRWGERVEWSTTSTVSRPVAPAAMVEPVEETGDDG